MGLMFINALAFATDFTDIGHNYKLYDFEGSAIATSSSLIFTFDKVGGASGWGVVDYTQSAGTVTTYEIAYLDSYSNVISTENGTVGTLKTINDMDGGRVRITIESGQGAPVTATGRIKFNYGGGGSTSSSGDTPVSINSSIVLSTEVDNQHDAQRIVPQVVLNAVTSTGSSTAQETTQFRNVTFFVYKTGTATVDIQEAPTDTDALFVTTQLNVAGKVVISNESNNFVRANVTAYTSGSVTVYQGAGN